MKLLRYLSYALGGVALLTIIALLVVYGLSERALASARVSQPLKLAQPTAAQLADGPHMLRVLGCQGCHGDKLQGENFLNDPKLATVYAPNLTLLAAHSTDAQLDRAIRQGIGTDGRALIIMPSQSYQFLSDQESAALIAAIRQFAKTGADQPHRSIGPVGRIGLVSGKFFTTPQLAAQYRQTRLPNLGPQFAAGRHFAEIKCSECHGPDLKGKEVEPGVVSSDLSIVGAYDLEQFKTLLRTGVPPSRKKLGLMAEVATSDFAHLTDEEIADTHAYLAEWARRQP